MPLVYVLGDSNIIALYTASGVKLGTVLEWVSFIIVVLLKYGEKSLHLEGSVVH